MSINLYDKALLDKIKEWTENTQIQIYGPEETRRMFEVMADTTQDARIKLPIVCLRRRGGYSILNINKRPLSYDGMMIDATEEQSIQLNAIPISIPYQIDIYTKYLEEADNFTRDFVFNIINHSTLKVTIPYNSVEYVHQANIRLDGDIEDNSDIPERIFTGQFSRMSIAINIDDAWLWDAKIRTNVGISFEDSSVDG